MLIIPCRLPYSCTEHPIGEATVARMLGNPGFSKEILVIVFNLLGTKHLFTTSDNSSCICAKCVLLLLQQKEVFGVELLRLFLSICLSVCYHLEVIWQPKAAQNLLWNLIITALMLMIPCCLPHSCTERPIYTPSKHFFCIFL